MRFESCFRTVWFLLLIRATAGSEPTSDPSVGKWQREPSLIRGQYKCLELFRARENRTGIFCSHMWDGSLCWTETPAGTSVTQNCPDQPDLEATEEVTQYCDDSGNWVQTGSTCEAALKDKSQELQFLKDAAEEPVKETAPVWTERVILENEKKCLEKMKNDPPYNKSGLHCSRNWDGWLCWDDTPGGKYASQNCPHYFDDFDPTEKVSKYCGADGQWFHHPKTNKVWTNYTLCSAAHDKNLRLKMYENEHKCLRKMKDDPPFSKAALAATFIRVSLMLVASLSSLFICGQHYCSCLLR